MNKNKKLQIKNPLSQSIEIMVEELSSNPWKTVFTIETPLGLHGVEYGMETVYFDKGDIVGLEYAVVGFTFINDSDVMPFADIDDGTYGFLKGLRFYREDLWLDD